jgi:hypothetical protein
MIRFRICILVFVLFALVSFLAFSPPDGRSKTQNKGNSSEDASISSPIPQKIENSQ